ncbi:MAG: tyrosine-type recombinase/integrase [Candidatus Polarisedimenticolaceae bacterium]|nr:tyrosine-type recombinase/integrase [Candidatus Polarisedimenticolaceae bacterium]
MLSTPAYADREQDLNLVKFSIWSGPRLSEVLALAWEDVIDLDKGLIKFNRSVVRGAYRVTKTKQSNRVHELLAPAKEALREQYDLTHHLKPVSVDVKQRDNRTMKEERVRFVFYNAYTNAPHTHDKSIREGFFVNHLKEC